MSTSPSSRPVPKRHQSFFASAILPGEDPEEFSVLFRELRDLLRPVGSLERSHVRTIAELLWRKDRLGIFRLAEQARLEFGDYFTDGDIEAGMIHAFFHRVEKDRRDFERSSESREHFKELKKALLDLGTRQDEIEKHVIPDEDREASRAKVHAEAQQELAKNRAENQFAILGDLISPECILQELEFRERLDADIERALKRLKKCQDRRLSGPRDRHRPRWGSVRSH